MNILTALALLKNLLDGVPRLKSLASNPKNEELPTFDNEVRRIIRETWGVGSIEYARYNGIFRLMRVESQADKEQAYIDHVSRREKALKDIIQEHDLPAKVVVLDKKKVFLGSTSNDLKDVRAELRELIPALGFALICFENPSFKKLPRKHAHDMCLDNVPDCDIYVLIIDERFGEEYAGSDPNLRGKSITWAEVEVALRENRAICTFVRKEVWNEKSTYAWNMKKGNEIEPFFAKDKRVFQFIEYIATQTKDNWIDQFQDVVELKELIRKRLPQM